MGYMKPQSLIFCMQWVLGSLAFGMKLQEDMPILSLREPK